MTEPARLMRFVLELRQAGITDARVLAALERTPRSAYAPEHLEGLAMDDIGLPLGHGQAMTKPSIVGRVVSALQVGRDDSVLEIGTGSGYQSAVLGDLAAKVVTLDRWAALVEEARTRFAFAHLPRITAFVADGALGWPEDAPYDRIVFNAAFAEPADVVFDQLKPGGVLVAPLIVGAEQRLIRFRNGQREDLGPIKLPLLEPGLPDV